jgi:hypothetical protein
MMDEETIAALEAKGKLGWRAAMELLEPFGKVAANFAETIRVLVNHYEHGSGEMPLSGRNLVIRLLKNNTIKAAYYFVAKSYRPQIIASKNPLTVKDLFEGFSAIEHAAILSLCYLFRNLSKRSDKVEWEYVQAPLYEALSIGSSMGQCVPEVGLAFGMLSRGLRYLAFAPFLVGNRRGFKEYRRHLTASDLPFDLRREHKIWECTNIQVAAVLLSYMGFNRTVVIQFVAAAERDLKVSPDELYGVRFRIAEAILDAYFETGEIPEHCPEWVGKKLPLSVDTRGSLLTSFRQVLSEDTRIEWLNKGSASINPDSTPEFFADGGVPVEPESEVEAEPLSIAEPPPESVS